MSFGATPPYRRRVLTPLVSLAAVLGAVALLSAAGETPGSPGDTIADAELGQIDFVHSYINFGGPGVVQSPISVVADSVGHLYVSDSDWCRVLGWRDAASFTNGAPADLLIFQPGFYSNQCLYLPSPVAEAADSAGNLYVAMGNTVGVFSAPFAACSSFPCVYSGSPSLVFGGGGGGTSADTLSGPAGVAFDSAGNLYIADSGNNRVLEYDAPFTGGSHSGTPGFPGDTTADMVFGQNGSFTSNSANNGTLAGDVNGIGPDSLNHPTSVAVDPAGNLYVADNFGSRVLEYNTPLEVTATPGSGDAIADHVFGQNNNFTTWGGNQGKMAGDVNGLGPDSLYAPSSVAVDSAGNLFVADQLNSRVLEYNTPLQVTATPGSGDTIADTVFGQDNNFTIGLCDDVAAPGDVNGIGPDTLCGPRAVALDSAGNLYVADPGDIQDFYGRVLEYNTPLQTTGVPGSGDNDADRVLGQIDLFHNVLHLGGPQGVWLVAAVSPGQQGVAVDAAGHLYVADSVNNRVLGWHNAASFTNGQPADLVIGQPDFYSDLCNHTSASFPQGCESPPGVVSADSLCLPAGVAVDSAGNFYIADSGNNRVLEYDTPFASFSGAPIAGLSANRVFGQGNSFTAADCNDGTAAGDVNGVGPDSLGVPSGVGVDSAGNLYVADTVNSRVLEYNTPLQATVTPGSGDTIADMVFGQDGSFTANDCDDGAMAGDVNGVGPDSLCSPMGVGTDAAGNLYVADTGNSRVLEYNTPLQVTGTPGSGDAIADTVFGQGGSFTSYYCGIATPPSGLLETGANSLCGPVGVAIDSAGNLYVGDSKNSRVLEYNTPLRVTGIPGSGDTNADLVFGQNGSFTATLCNNGTMAGDVNGVGPDSLCFLTGVAVDSAGNLYVADRANNRVLRFDDPLASTPTPTPTATATPTATGTPTPTATPTPVPETLTITPADLSFGSVKTAKTARPKTVTIANKKGKKGKNSLPVLVFGVIAPNNGFAISSNNCPSTLPAGQQCELGVTFTPESKGRKTSAIQINDNANGNPQTVDLSGKGT